MPKCEALTLKGLQCSRNPLQNSHYCFQHSKSRPSSIRPSSPRRKINRAEEIYHSEPNFYPLTQLNENTFVEGYWESVSPECVDFEYSDSDTSDSEASEQDKKSTNRNYSQIFNRCILQKNKLQTYPYPLGTNEKVDKKFLKKFKKVTEFAEFDNFKGTSWCRICNEPNGSGEYTINYRGKIYKYPEGLEHYYVEHNVKPSDEFKEAIMAQR